MPTAIGRLHAILGPHAGHHRVILGRIGNDWYRGAPPFRDGRTLHLARVGNIIATTFSRDRGGVKPKHDHPHADAAS